MGKKRNVIVLTKSYLSLFFYYAFFRYLPNSSFFIGGKIFKQLRYFCCKNIFLSCGANVNIERMAMFGSGRNLKIGDNSGIGLNCVVPSDIIIGNDVMMGPNVYILSTNHEFSRLDVPMWKQGNSKKRQTIIKDDVWIGRQVIFTPGRIVARGTIVGAGTVLTKDFPEYSIVGGNPSKFLRNRISKIDF